jgi:hypothetical protein
VEFPVGLPTGNDVTLPWWTLQVTETVEGVYIASSANADFDDIVLTVLTRSRGALDTGTESKE